MSESNVTSNDRMIPGDVDLPRLVAGLHELSKAFIEGNQGRYGMRIPAEPYHDGDLVCGQAARMLDLFSDQWARRCKEVERLRAALERSRDTFADFERTCAMLGRGLMADAARIAREDCIRNLGPETGSPHE